MKKIEIYEVGPRDGFQSVSEFIPTETKKNIIDKIIESGVRNIQHTSFVSPKAIPQLRDSKELTSYCLETYDDVTFFALVPNYYGAKLASESNLEVITYVTSLGETHNKANINKTHEESLEDFKRIKDDFPNLDVSLDLSTAFGCPFEGKFSPEKVVEFLTMYTDLGLKKVNLCDTIGIANPKEVRDIIRAIQQSLPSLEISVHIHDTRNMGMVNTLAAIECGVTKVESTLGGLGGCPFAPGATGNLATEDLVYMLNGMGYETNIKFDLLLEAAKYQQELLGNENFSGHHINININEFN